MWEGGWSSTLPKGFGALIATADAAPLNAPTPRRALLSRGDLLWRTQAHFGSLVQGTQGCTHPFSVADFRALAIAGEQPLTGKTWGLFQRMSVIKSALSSGFGSTLGPGRGGGACFGLAYVADSLTVLAALRALGPVGTGLGPLEQTQNKSIEACNLQSQRVPANLLRVGSELSYQYFSQQYTSATSFGHMQIIFFDHACSTSVPYDAAEHARCILPSFDPRACPASGPRTSSGCHSPFEGLRVKLFWEV